LIHQFDEDEKEKEVKLGFLVEKESGGQVLGVVDNRKNLT
jgi:hypothetical protein